VDGSDKLHISYFDLLTADLKYATNTSGIWVTSIVDSTDAVGTFTSIAVDGSDNVHISYYDATNGDLKYATPDGLGGWDISTLDDLGDVGWYTSITIDGMDDVHISYYDVDNTNLKYITNRSGPWVAETVDTGDVGGNVGWYTSIAIDASDAVHISYHDVTNADLKYALMGGSGTWQTSTLVNDLDVGSYSAIALGSVHVSHYNATNGDLNLTSTVAPQPAGVAGGGGGCFIATAVYGSDMAPQVINLRNFRDTYLLPSFLGRKCVNMYYRYSAPIAAFLSKHETLSTAGRIVLLPAVGVSYLAVRFGPVLTPFLFFLGFAAAMVLFRSARQKRARPSLNR